MMFKNAMIHFSLTNNIVSKLEKIHAIWGVIENAKLVPEWEQKLKKIARLRSGVFSTKIEGNQITLEQAEKYLAGKKIQARKRDKQELKNYMSTLEYIESQENEKSITNKHILKIHSLVTKKILTKGLQKYREQQNAIYNAQGEIVFMPPEFTDVLKFMNNLLEYINSHIEISPLIRAAILHHWFVIIHPFVDGNGRTARALTQMFLYQNGFNTKKYFSLEEYYDADLKNYYISMYIGHNFYDSEESGINCTKFIEYFLSGMLDELGKLKKQIESMKIPDGKNESRNGLTNRQIHFLAFVNQRVQVKS